MNLAFWILLALVLTILWFIISPKFIPLGKFMLKVWDGLVEILNKEE